MDEETKKIFAKLYSSVEAMQAGIETLKGARNTGKTPASLQDSNIVSSNHSKRRKIASKTTNSDNEENELFVDLCVTGRNRRINNKTC